MKSKAKVEKVTMKVKSNLPNFKQMPKVSLTAIIVKKLLKLNQMITIKI